MREPPGPPALPSDKRPHLCDGHERFLSGSTRLAPREVPCGSQCTHPVTVLGGGGSYQAILTHLTRLNNLLKVMRLVIGTQRRISEVRLQPGPLGLPVRSSGGRFGELKEHAVGHRLGPEATGEILQVEPQCIRWTLETPRQYQSACCCTVRCSAYCRPSTGVLFKKHVICYEDQLITELKC